MGSLQKIPLLNRFFGKPSVAYALETPYQHPWNHLYFFRGWATGSGSKRVEALRLLHRGKAIILEWNEDRSDIFDHLDESIPVNSKCGFNFPLHERDPHQQLTLQVRLEGSKRWHRLMRFCLVDLNVQYQPICHLHLDELLINKESQRQLLRGWIVARDHFQITDLKAMIDGEELQIVREIERPDVVEQLPSEERALHPGFEIELSDFHPELYLRLFCEIENRFPILCWEGHLNDIPQRELDHALGIHVFAEGLNYDMTHFLDACFHDLANPFKKKVVGWIFDPEDADAIQGVRLRFRNTIVEGSIGIERPDVGRHFSAVPHSSHAGFEIEINDFHGDPYLIFDYKDKDGHWMEFTFKTIDDLFRFDYLDQKITEKESGVKYRVDVAQIGRAFGCQYLIVGWCFRLDDQPIVGVRMKANDEIFEADIQKKRSDVRSEHFATHKTSERSGFEIPVFGINLKDDFTLEYQLEDSDWTLFAEQNFSTLELAHFSPFHKRRHDYQLWKKNYQKFLRFTDREARSIYRKLKEKPLISILLPTYNSDLRFLRKAVNSVSKQHYPNWELCIADDHSSDEALKAYLRKLDTKESRVRVVFRKENGHISAATQSAYEVSSGSWITFLDHDDQLHVDALLRVANEINRDENLRLIYSDEDKLKADGRFDDPFFKPNWDPYLLECQNYLCHLMAMTRELYEEVGGLREGYEGSQDWDLALRATELLQENQIYHLPYVLYHWREIEGSTALSLGQKNYIRESSRKTLGDYLQRKNIQGDLYPAPHGHWNIIRKPVNREPSVSIIIPTKNRKDLLEACITSIRKFTHYRNYEILIVDNESDDPETLAYFESIRGRQVRILSFVKPFNYSAMNNLAAGKSKADVLLFLNNDVTIQSAPWLMNLALLAREETVGAVGALLLYPEDCIQHAGIVLGVDGVAGHAFKYFPKGAPGQRNRINLLHQVTAVTGACLAVSRKHFMEVQGFDEKHLKVALNDVDLCLKLRLRGLHNLMAPRAVLNHHESSTRRVDTSCDQYVFERDFIRDKWKELFEHDPFYNPNLSLKWEDYSYSFPPALGNSRSKKKKQ